MNRIAYLAVVWLATGPIVLSAQRSIDDAIPAIAAKLTGEFVASDKRRVAVLSLRDVSGRPTILGALIAERLTTSLFDTRKIDIVERLLIDKLLGELRLQQSGALDPDSARKVGKIAGVDAIVTGTIADLVSYVDVNCRLIDTETGRIISVAQSSILKDRNLEMALNEPVVDTAAPSPSNKTGNDTPLQRKSVKGVTVELRRCEMDASGAVRCELSFTNQDRDRGVGLFQARAFDLRGGEYISDRGQIGGNGSRMNDSGIGTNRMEAHLISGVQTPAYLIFEQLPPDTTSFSVLYLEMFIRHPDTNISVGSERIDFRSITVGRKR